MDLTRTWGTAVFLTRIYGCDVPIGPRLDSESDRICGAWASRWQFAYSTLDLCTVRCCREAGVGRLGAGSIATVSP